MARRVSTHPELVWPGKRNAEGVPCSPKSVPGDVELRVVETIGRPLGPEDTDKLPFDGEVPCQDAPNTLIVGDSLLVIQALLPDYAGKVRLVYIDPPFDVGAGFSSDVHSASPDPYLEVPAFLDRWGDGDESYAAFMHERLLLIRRLLAPDGTLYVHCDYRSNSLLRFICDEVMGEGNFRNEIIWSYNSGPRTKRDFGRRHDTILRYSVTDDYYFNPDAVREPYSPDINVPASKAHYYHPDGKVPGDVWDIDIISQNDKSERTGYPTQKPEALLRRIIAASSEEGDIVADSFCGSGTTLAVAQRMGRGWIGCDVGPVAVNTTRKRIIDINRASLAPAPFSVCEIVESEQDERVAESGGVSAEVISYGNGQIGVRLTAFTPVIPAMTKKKRAAFEDTARQNPLALLDSWSVDFEHVEGSPFTCDWEAHRTRTARDIPFDTGPVWRGDPPDSRSVCVRAVDVFGREYRTYLMCPTPP